MGICRAVRDVRGFHGDLVRRDATELDARAKLMNSAAMHLADVNLNLLVALKALLDERHVSRAAARCNVTQSAMSKSLSRLREMFGDKLLVRSGNSLVPTPLADRLLPQLDDVLRDINTVLESGGFNPATSRRSFAVSVTDYLAQHVLPEALSRAFAEAPHVSIDIRIWDVRGEDALREGKVDVASCILYGDPAPDMMWSVSGQDGFVCMMRAAHPLAVQVLTLESYTAYPHAVITSGTDKQRVIDQAVSRAGARRSIGLRVPLYASAMQTVSRSDMLLTVPAHIARNLAGRYGLVLRDLPFSSPRFKYGLMWHRRTDADPGNVWLRSHLLPVLESSCFSR